MPDYTAVPASTIPAVKAYLVQAITAAVADPSVLVVYGEPSTEIPDDVIAVTDTERKTAPTQLVGSGAAGWLFENYEQTVVISCVLGGDDPGTQQQVEARAYQLLAVVEVAVRVDPSLGGLVASAWPSSSTSTGGAAASDDGDPSGQGCDIDLKITVDPTPQ